MTPIPSRYYQRSRQAISEFCVCGVLIFSSIVLAQDDSLRPENIDSTRPSVDVDYDSEDLDQPLTLPESGMSPPEFDMKRDALELKEREDLRNSRESSIQTAELYVRIGRYKYAVEYLSGEMQEWTNPEDKEYLVKACDYLFAVLYGQDEHIKLRDKLASCPAETLDHWYSTEDRNYLAVVKVAPCFPAEARSESVTGQVLVQYDISKGGYPRNIEVLKSTNEIFIKPTLDSVKQYRYLPRIVNGKPAKAIGVKTRVTFRLEDS